MLVGSLSLATALMGCTGSYPGTSKGPQRMPVHTALPPTTSTEVPPSTEGPVGTVQGVDDECAGLATARPRNASIRLLFHGRVVASERLVAGDPAWDHYSVDIAPGRYRVEATNWPAVNHVVSVRKDNAVTADFLNDCN
jgi:hypothetical protein